jgi:hypothetical protein
LFVVAVGPIMLINVAHGDRRSRADVRMHADRAMAGPEGSDSMARGTAGTVIDRPPADVFAVLADVTKNARGHLRRSKGT